MNKDIKNLRENILSALPLSMAKEYEKMNRELNSDKEGYYYRKFKPIFDKAFGKDEKGRMIYRKYINVDNMPIDREIEQFLKQNGYSISEEEFNAGIIIKNKDTLSNKYSLEELQKKGMVLRIGRILNKKKAPQNIILKWDKIAKQISNKKLIVISRHPYDIAGQSTDRSWESCMTLQTDKQKEGCNSCFVDTGIEAGVLIAYLISNTDKNINKPLARVLIKPYTNYDESEIQFKVSKVYGTAGNEFQNAVQKWVNRNLNSRHIKVDENMRDLDLHLDTNIYNDEDYDTYENIEEILETSYIYSAQDISDMFNEDELDINNYIKFNYKIDENLEHSDFDFKFIENCYITELDYHIMTDINLKDILYNFINYKYEVKQKYINSDDYLNDELLEYGDKEEIIKILNLSVNDFIEIIRSAISYFYERNFDVDYRVSTNPPIYYVENYLQESYKGDDITIDSADIDIDYLIDEDNYDFDLYITLEYSITDSSLYAELTRDIPILNEYFDGDEKLIVFNGERNYNTIMNM